MIIDQKTNKQIIGVFLIDGTLDGTQLATTVKPNKFKLFFIKFLLGWRWISIKNLKSSNK